MKITNYKEFIDVINGLFHADEVKDFTLFQRAMAESKISRNIKRNRCQCELKKLKSELNDCKQNIRQIEDIDVKRKYSEELKKLTQIKRDLLKKNKELSELNLFNEMSENAKIYACCRHLFSKYIPQALCDDLISGAQKNNDGSLTVNIQLFKDSRLYQDAAHIIDYVSSYFENYPERIKGTRYFIGLHRKAKNFSDLLNDINFYFEKLNSPSEKESNLIKKSHMGIKVVKTYPERNLQVVNIKNKAGLNYEGCIMHHCVGSYASRVEKGETQIYSLRDMGDVNKELVPHATIEVKNGKIKQIKGRHDGIIACEYVDTVRDMLLTLIKSSDFNDIINDDGIAIADKNNIGIFKDVNGKIHDLFSIGEQEVTFGAITITQEALTALPLHKMKIKNLTYRGFLSEKNLVKLLNLNKVEQLCFSSLEYEGETFDYSNSQQISVSLNMTSPNVKRIILSPKTQKFSLKGNLDNLESIITAQNMEDILLEGSFTKLKKIPSTSILSLKGEFPALKLIKTNILTSLKIQSDNINYMLDEYLFPNLRHLSLYGGSVAFFDKLPEIPLLETLLISGGNCNLGKQFSGVGDNFTVNYPHLKSLVLDGTFPQVEQLDLSYNPKLKNLEALGARFENLKMIKFPTSLSTCVFDFADLPVLNDLDFSQVKSKRFGILDISGLEKLKFGYSGDNVPKNSTFSLEGISLSFAHFNSLESIEFPIISEEISLQNLSGLSVKKFNFEKLTKLRELNFSLLPFKEVIQFNLSACQNLKSVGIDIDNLGKTILPDNLEHLSIVSVGKDEEISKINFDSDVYKKIKILDCTGFLPDGRLLGPSVENLIIQANNKDLSNITQIDMGRYKYVDLQISGSSMKKLEKIIFPQTFKKMHICETSDKFVELDFSNTIGDVKIHKQGDATDAMHKSYFKIIRNSIVREVDNLDHGFDNFLFLSDEQMQKIKNIKLGKNTRLYICPDMSISPELKVESVGSASESFVEAIHKKNLQMTFVKSCNSEKIQNAR